MKRLRVGIVGAGNMGEQHAKIYSRNSACEIVAIADAIQAQVRFADGDVATVEACWVYPNTFPSMPDSFVEVITAGAAIHLDRKCEQIEVSTAKAFQYPRNLLAYTYADGEVHGAVRLSLDHFLKCVLEDREPMITLESSLRVTRILEAIQHSIEARTPIRL
jgi:predicted dehydrogenase